MDAIKSQIRSFLGEHLNHTPLQDDDDIFAQGFVNSLFAMRLVLFVEDTFHIQLSNEELDPDNFRTIDRITALVRRKLSAGGRQQKS
ncbi:MAG: acyl carrier protein [Chloroflexi bacterium]|nr:acyl carrier protein [Chloroflexota bacterium]